MAYKYKLNPVTGKLDLVNKEEGSGGGIEEINSADKSIKISKNNKSIDLSVGLSSSDSSITITPTEGKFDITAPSLKMLEGYKCGFGSNSTTGNAKFCDLYWTERTGAVDVGHIFTVIFKYIGDKYYILVTATVKFIYGEINGKQVCDAVIEEELIYSSKTVSQAEIDKISVSKNLKIDYIKDATTSTATTSEPTDRFGHAAIYMQVQNPYGGNYEFHPLSALSIQKRNSGLCYFIMNPECTGSKCSQYTPGKDIRDAKILAPSGGGGTEYKAGENITIQNNVISAVLDDYLDKTYSGTNVLNGSIQVGSAQSKIPNSFLNIRNVSPSSVTGSNVNGAGFAVSQDGTSFFMHKTYNNDGSGAKNDATLRFSGKTGLQFAINTGSGDSPSESMYKNVAMTEDLDSKQEKLTPGDGIVIENNVISYTPKKVKLDTEAYVVANLGAEFFLKCVENPALLFDILFYWDLVDSSIQYSKALWVRKSVQDDNPSSVECFIIVGSMGDYRFFPDGHIESFGW